MELWSTKMSFILSFCIWVLSVANMIYAPTEILFRYGLWVFWFRMIEIDDNHVKTVVLLSPWFQWKIKSMRIFIFWIKIYTQQRKYSSKLEAWVLDCHFEPSWHDYCDHWHRYVKFLFCFPYFPKQRFRDSIYK